MPQVVEFWGIMQETNNDDTATAQPSGAQRSCDTIYSFEKLDEMYQTARAYESLCFKYYIEAKKIHSGNMFVRSLGFTLSKYNRLTAKQLQGLIALLEKRA